MLLPRMVLVYLKNEMSELCKWIQTHVIIIFCETRDHFVSYGHDSYPRSYTQLLLINRIDFKTQSVPRKYVLQYLL